MLNVHLVGKQGKPVSVGYVTTTGKVQLDLTRMKSYVLDNRTGISLQDYHSGCQGTYGLGSEASHVVKVS